MTIRSKPSNDAFRANYDRIFEGIPEAVEELAHTTPPNVGDGWSVPEDLAGGILGAIDTGEPIRGAPVHVWPGYPCMRCGKGTEVRDLHPGEWVLCADCAKPLRPMPIVYGTASVSGTVEFHGAKPDAIRKPGQTE